MNAILKVYGFICLPFITFISFSFQDSARIKARLKVEAFYNWYCKEINTKLSSAYKPKIVKNNDGNMDLDFKQYFEELKRLDFTENLIKKEKSRFADCKKNLRKTTHKQFKKFTDLDQFEAIDCDFGNYFHWIGGQMEPIDEIEIQRIVINDNNKIKVIVKKVNHEIRNRKSYARGIIEVELEKINKEWKIDDINFIKPH